MRDQPLIKTTRVRIPTVLKDEWEEQAECRGMNTVDVPVDLCQSCPVKLRCATLYRDLKVELWETTPSKVLLDGTWGGKQYHQRITKRNKKDQEEVDDSTLDNGAFDE